ncbi:hypothetical protein D3C78_1381340 [compost metagenome]
MLQTARDAQTLRCLGPASLDARRGQQGQLVFASEFVHDFQRLAVLRGDGLVGPAPQEAAFAVAGGAHQADRRQHRSERAVEGQGGSGQIPVVGRRSLQPEVTLPLRVAAHHGFHGLAAPGIPVGRGVRCTHSRSIHCLGRHCPPGNWRRKRSRPVAEDSGLVHVYAR